MAIENAFCDGGGSPPATVPTERQETEPFGLIWTSYSTPALHDIVTGSIKELTALSRRGQTELRQRLLPALQEVRNRLTKGEQVNGHDTITGYLAAIGLSEGVIRKWEFRLRETDLKELLGLPSQPAPQPWMRTVSGQAFFDVLSALQSEIRRALEKDAVQHAMQLEGIARETLNKVSPFHRNIE